MNYSSRRIWYYYFRERYLWSGANRVLTVSNILRSDLNKFYSIPLTKTIAVYNGVDTELFKNNLKDRPSLPGVENKRIILYVGHFGPRKGISFLLDSMTQVVKKFPDVALVCVGGLPQWLGDSSYIHDLQQMVNKNALGGNVFLMDRVPNNQLPGYYSIASIFVLPSYFESFAKVAVEAMSCSRAVIATRGGGVDEVVIDGETGLLVDFGSSSLMADAIIKLLTDESLARRMGAQGRKRVEKYFTWKTVAERVDNVYDEVYSGKRSFS